MKITDIKQQVKRQSRYSIYIDEKYSFSLSGSELMSQGLRIGQQFNAQEFDEIRNTAEEDKAYMRAIEMLARRPRSVWEMQFYLKNKGYNDNVIEKIVNKLTKKRLLDDKAFAQSWVSSRRLLKSTSRRRLTLELKQKRVASSVIESVLADDETDDKDSLRELIDKKRKITRYQDDQKLTAYLMRQGFSYQDIRDSLDES